MFRNKVQLLFTALLISASISSGSMVASSASMADPACGALRAEQKIKHIAKLLVKNYIDDARICYNTLSGEAKAQVFIAMAEERGIADPLRQETDENRLQDVGTQTHTGSAWQQLIEHSIVLEGTRVYGNSWSQNALCDNDPSDIDYDFIFTFSFSVSNPNLLETYSNHPSVDAMLWYYQNQYGGVNGRGYTDRPGVRVCLGDNGVANAGGPNTVRSYMILEYAY